mmetsp:Transcript_6202/g.22714  ORF Transcript_6202/g.22714 Transcript_6202/m.22714 type:complete len:238 (-) Transcript_6202:942-1655(-)
MTPATRAGGNGSRSALVKALRRTLFAVVSERYPATLPRRIVVLARIAGSTSVCSLLRCFSIPWCDRCESFGANRSVDLSVSSRRYGSSSANPVCVAGHTVSSTTFSGRCSANACKFSNSAIRTVLSALEVNSLTMVGVTRAANVSASSPFAACSIGWTASAGALPNTSASATCGRIFRSTHGLARDSSTRGRCRKNCSFSIASLSERLSRNVVVSTSLFANSAELSTSFFGLYRRAG